MTSKYSFKPPWITCPGIPSGDIGWRMGFGEDEMIKFWDNIDAFTSEERIEYFEYYEPPDEDWEYWTTFVIDGV